MIFQAKTVAEQLAAKLNDRLNYQPTEGMDGPLGVSEVIEAVPWLPGVQRFYTLYLKFLQENQFSLESTNPQVQKKYEEELEINEFPQQARWRITNKETLAQIGDYSEAGITVRGTFVPPGKAPPEGERKLYLAIESMSELAVSKAKAEICRILKEEMLRLQTSSSHVGSKGRYKVV